MTSLIGQSIGRYQILSQLGEGGMATVYKAYDTQLERDVAIKVLRMELFGQVIFERIQHRFEREAKTLGKLSHPNIVKVYDCGVFEGRPYLVMEYLSGGTLKSRTGTPIPWNETVNLLLPIAEALEYAHEHKVLHRDVKPSNILIAEKGQLLLSDFGIAKILDLEDTQTITSTGAGIGTPDYASPEQALGHPINVGTDIYSLGVVLYELITGHRPFQADTPMGLVVKHVSEPLPSPKKFIPDLPDEVENVLVKALAKSPDERFADMRAFIQALKDLNEVGIKKMPLAIETGTMGGSIAGTAAKETKRRTDVKVDRSRLMKLLYTGAAVIGILALLIILVVLFPFKSPVGGDTLPDLSKSGSAASTSNAVALTPTPNLPLGSVRLMYVSGDVLVEIPGDGKKGVSTGNSILAGVGVFIETGAGKTAFILPNGSKVVLDENTLIELKQVADPRQNQPNTEIVLERGKVFSAVSLAIGGEFIIRTASGAQAQVMGSIMGARYEPDNRQYLSVDCLEGKCRILGVNPDNSLDLVGGDSGMLYSSEAPRLVCQWQVDSWISLLRIIKDDVLIATITPIPSKAAACATSKPNITPTISPTVTHLTHTPASTWTPTPICFSLEVFTNGPGSVDTNPSPNCSDGKYTQGMVVTLNASPNASSVFTGWSGGASGSSNPITLTMDGNKSVTGNFAACYTLTTSKNGSGTIRVEPPPNCSEKYVSGTVVSLLAIPGHYHNFIEWSGSISGSTNPADLTMNSDKTVIATFLQPCYTITTSTNPNGAGTIILPQQTCPGGYLCGTVVIVDQIPASGYTFSNWSGDCSGSSCNLSMNGNHSITANYVLSFSLMSKSYPDGLRTTRVSPFP